MSTTILGRRVKKVRIDGVVVLAIPAGPHDLAGLPVLVWSARAARWTTTTIEPAAIVGDASSHDKRIRTAREAASRLL